MINLKESIRPISSSSVDISDRNAAHLAGSIAENLGDGEYVISMIPTMVIFVRSDDWHKDLYIEKIDFSNKYIIQLSTGRIIDFYADQIRRGIDEHGSYRIVILSEKGFSTFKVSIDEN